MEKSEMKISDFFGLDGIVHGFFIVFFSLFIGKFGIASLILASDTSWNVLFNIGIWFVLVSFCVNHFFDAAENKKKRRLKEKKK